MGKTLITGATGGLGGAVADLLASKIPAASIAVLARDAAKAQRFADAGLEVRVGDYDNKASLVVAFTGIDTLYFVSGSDVNSRLPQHENVIQAAKAAGVEHIVYTSSVRKTETADAPLYPVLHAHLQTEAWIKESGLAYTITQHNLYAEVVPVFAGSHVLENKSIYIATGAGKSAFALREDFADAEAIILANPAAHVNKVYHFTGSEGLSFGDIATLAGEASGLDIAFVSPAIPEYEAALTGAGLPGFIVAMLSQFSQAIALGEFDTISPDLEQVLGRKPKDVKAFIRNAYSAK